MRLALLASSLLFVGCSGHYLREMRGVHSMVQDGKPLEAYEALKAKTDGTEWDKLLVALDSGAMLHRGGKWKESADALNAAIDLADQRETVSIGEETFGRAPFRMANHEKQALHAMQAINYLMLGQTDEAVVEARLTDLRQTRLEADKERSASSENFITASTVDEKQRAFFEKLVFGRYVSAVARERSGDLDGAFIDYWQAVTLKQRAPLDAQIELNGLAPHLLWLAETRERPELAELQKIFPGVKAEVPKGDGELVLLVEQGFAPRAVLDETIRAYRLTPAIRSDWPVYAMIDGPVVPEVVSSLEELATRRGYRGLLVDRERSASIAINTVLFFGYFVLMPVALPLLIKKGYESTIRDAQSWATLPASFAVARVRLPPGKHTVKVPGLLGQVEREVEIVKGQVTVLTTEGP